MTSFPLPRAVTHRRVLAIALPIVISNATVPILGAVDTAVVGRIGTAAPIGAVGLGAVILAALYAVLSFLRMGTTGLVAQELGRGDAGAAARHLARAVIIGLAAGAAVALLQPLLIAGGLSLSPASDEVEALARQYLGLRLWGAPAAITLYALTGYLIAAERTRGVLALQLLMNGVNIALDLAFVPGFGWGVPGVAAATLIAEWAGLGLGLWLCRDALRLGLSAGWARIFDRARMARVLRVNGDIMIRSLLLQLGFLTFLFLGARAGDVTLAANQVLLQFLEITAYALDGFAFAAEALVGQAVGARSRPLLRRAGVVTSLWGLAGALGLTVLFLGWGEALIALMTTAPAVRAEAAAHLWWMGLLPVLSLACWMLDGIYIGATRTREMRNAMIVAIAGYFALMPLLVGSFGSHGIWAALLAMNLMRGLTLAVLYPRLERAVVSGEAAAA
ncbi:MATE family efflux transporter [Frigidibacter sp. MR17.24]|uniref:MATE family efflux transporter n=1 Tax=Frigidibacter sp. MR17.24 TaxID=3127345 RepID=UPI003012A624